MQKGAVQWIWLIVILLVLVGIAIALRSNTTGPTEEVASAEMPLVTSSQTPGSSVTIDSVYMAAPGFVRIIRTDMSSRSTLGTSAFLTTGVHEDVVVGFEVPVSADDVLLAEIVVDDGDETYEPDTDTAATDEDGNTIESEIALAIEEEGIPAVDERDPLMEEEDNTGTATGQDEALDDDSDDDTIEDESTTTEEGAVAEENTVSYTDTGFSPSPLTVQVGETITFVNDSSGEMWVASAMHPTHDVYDGTSREEHCPNPDGIAFDQCEAGETFSFTFDQSGTWGFHNHLNANHSGQIIVQ